MITLHNQTTRYTIKPENAQAYRAIIDSGKPPKLKIKIDRSHDATRRDYPLFKPGMTTADYVSHYAGLNSRLLLTEINFSHTDRAAPMLDLSIPEALEEIDPNFFPIKRRPPRSTPAQIRAVALELIQTLEGLAIHPSHYAKLKEMLA